ncbi:MAG: SRPBCC family protein [Acidimicrobiia bacterium]|nr:SRPBCC family protein [Acidimicrobiia bacterium]
MGRVVVTEQIAAPVERVWRALVEPAEVVVWDGVERRDVPDGYPRPGQHARWTIRVAGVRVALHDRIVAVEPNERFASEITVGFISLQEEYRLRATPGGGCELVSDNLVRSRVPLLGRLADSLTRRNVVESLARLRAHCEASPDP